MIIYIKDIEKETTSGLYSFQSNPSVELLYSCVHVALINRQDKEIGINLPNSLALDFQYDSTPKPGTQKGVHAKVKVINATSFIHHAVAVE